MRLVLALLTALSGLPALAEPPRIVADTPVTASLVLQVTGTEGRVHVLLPRGADAHHHQMRPSDAGALQEADLLVWTGPALTPWLDRAAGVLGGDVGQVRLLEVRGTELQHFASDHEDAGGNHGQGGEAVDPHAWLDPDNARLWLDAVAARLGAIDPQRRGTYAANARAASARIGKLDRRLQARLAPHANNSIVVLHDAYGYFTRHFGLMPAIAVSPGDAGTPSVARMRAVRGRIADAGATCAFPEGGNDPREMAAIAREAGLRLGAEVSPEGRGEADARLYAAVLTGLADSLAECLTKASASPDRP